MEMATWLLVFGLHNDASSHSCKRLRTRQPYIRACRCVCTESGRRQNEMFVLCVCLVMRRFVFVFVAFCVCTNSMHSESKLNFQRTFHCMSVESQIMSMDSIVTNVNAIKPITQVNIPISFALNQQPAADLFCTNERNKLLCVASVGQCRRRYYVGQSIGLDVCRWRWWRWRHSSHRWQNVW